MSFENIEYKRDKLKLENAYRRKKITLQQFYKFSGQLKGRYFGKEVKPEKPLKERAIEYFGLPLMEKVGKARDFN